MIPQLLGDFKRDAAEACANKLLKNAEVPKA
jgi:hypothetical protein